MHLSWQDAPDRILCYWPCSPVRGGLRGADGMRADVLR